MVLIKEFQEDKEDSEILWLAGLERQPDRGWGVRVVIQGADSRAIRVWRPMIGLLPLLTPGMRISEGFLLQTNKRGLSFNIDLPNLADGEEVTSSAIPAELYSFDGHQRGTQRLFRYCVDGAEILVPAIELVRYLFLHNKTLANVLMQPGGLMTLFRPEPIGFQSELHLRFTRLIPRDSLSPLFVQEFAWLAVHPDGRRAWDSVYERSRGQLFVTLDLPHFQTCKMRFRGVCAGRRWLVLEIEQLSGKVPPCDRLLYSHPLIRRKVPVPITKDGPGGISERELEHDKGRQRREIVVGPESGRIDARQRTLNVPAKVAAFDREIEVEKVYSVIQSEEPAGHGQTAIRPRTGPKEDETALRVRVISSVAPEAFGGTISPVEFQILEVASWNHLGELEALTKVIQVIAGRHTDIGISMSPCYLKDGRAISQAGRHRRAFLVVVFDRPGELPVVLLDVDHSGDRSLSSVVLHYLVRRTGMEIERDIQALMDEMVDNSGKWPRPIGVEMSDRVRCSRVAKLCRRQAAASRDDYIEAWADRLFELLFFDG